MFFYNYFYKPKYKGQPILFSIVHVQTWYPLGFTYPVEGEGCSGLSSPQKVSRD
jgi:hypothetical protein